MRYLILILLPALLVLAGCGEGNNDLVSQPTTPLSPAN